MLTREQVEQEREAYDRDNHYVVVSICDTALAAMDLGERHYQALHAVAAERDVLRAEVKRKDGALRKFLDWAKQPYHSHTAGAPGHECRECWIQNECRAALAPDPASIPANQRTAAQQRALDDKVENEPPKEAP